MMHPHVMNMIRISQMAKEGANAPEQIPVQELAFFKEFPVTKTM
jgi:hypothetical protein